MTIRDLVSIALFAALIIVLGFIPAIPIPALGVPITLQLMGVMMAGAMLGAKRGLCAVLIVWILAAIGLPILAPGRGGLAVFWAPTSGYLYGWAAGVVVIGALYHLFRNNLTPVKEAIAVVVGGIGVVHLFGILWLSFILSKPFSEVFIWNLIFIPGDVIKAAITVVVAGIVRKALPNSFQP